MKLPSIRKYLFFFILSYGLSGCGHLRMNWTSQPLNTASDYRDYRSTLLWGFSKSRQLDFSKLCQSQTPLKILTYYNFEDVLFTTLSFGFYSSQTIEVWCPAQLKKG